MRDEKPAVTRSGRAVLTVVVGAVLSCWCAAPGMAQAPQVSSPDFAKLSDGRSAQVYNRALTVSTEGGRAVARFDARSGDGGAVLNGVQVGDGVFEIDLKGKDVAQQSFLGIAFHLVDWTTFDAVYFRPFNFRAAEAERRAHSVQYVSHPANTWQRLRAERPGQFEGPLDPPPDPNDWFHARIVVANAKVEVYVNGAAKPSLVVDDLGANKSGGVALFLGNGSDGSFAGLRITATAPAGPPPASTQTIFEASATGNLARVRALVEADPATVRARTPSSDLTPLHVAALYGQRAVAEYLIEKGADVNASARHAGTVLDVTDDSDQPEPERQALVAWLQARGARFTQVRFETTQVSPAIRRLAFPWGMMNNVLVFSGSEGAVVVDSGFSARAVEGLKKEIAALCAPGTRFLVNTHGHGDHVAGNAIAPSPAAVITAASLAAGMPGLPITKGTEPVRGRSGHTLPAPYTLRTGGTTIELIPRPGLHSNQDVMVYFPSESVVDMGDLLLSESMPAVQDVAAYLAFLDDVLDVFPEKTTFVSGHGRDLDAAGVRAYRDTLTTMVGLVRAQLAAGRTAEQMVKDGLLKEYNARYSLLAFLVPDTLIPRVVAAAQKETPK